jgi:hypothetical protein
MQRGCAYEETGVDGDIRVHHVAICPVSTTCAATAGCCSELSSPPVVLSWDKFVCPCMCTLFTTTYSCSYPHAHHAETASAALMCFCLYSAVSCVGAWPQASQAG